MHDNDGDDDNGYDDDDGNDDDDEARTGRGFAWSVNWLVNREWIGETHEPQSWLVNNIFTATRGPLTLFTWRGFEVKPCKSEKLLTFDFLSIINVNFVVVKQKAENRQFNRHTLCFLNIKGSLVLRPTLAYFSPVTTNNHWWTWSVHRLIMWFVKWLQRLKWFVNVPKFNLWFEIQTPPSSPSRPWWKWRERFLWLGFMGRQWK